MTTRKPPVVIRCKRILGPHATVPRCDCWVTCEETGKRLHETAAEAEQGRVWQKYMRLSGGNLAVMEALLRGERVPKSQLDPLWSKAYDV